MYTCAGDYYEWLGSGGYQSCCIARTMFYEAYGTDMQIELIDSESYTYIYGQVVLHACEMRDAGDGFREHCTHCPCTSQALRGGAWCVYTQASQKVRTSFRRCRLCWGGAGAETVSLVKRVQLR